MPLNGACYSLNFKHPIASETQRRPARVIRTYWRILIQPECETLSGISSWSRPNLKNDSSIFRYHDFGDGVQVVLVNRPQLLRQVKFQFRVRQAPLHSKWNWFHGIRHSPKGQIWPVTLFGDPHPLRLPGHWSVWFSNSLLWYMEKCCRTRKSII